MKKKPFSTKNNFHSLNHEKENPTSNESLIIDQRMTNLSNLKQNHSSIMKKQSASISK